ncbi:hypothetical protein GCM10020216_010160 [Nonomuraea helvata]
MERRLPVSLWLCAPTLVVRADSPERVVGAPADRRAGTFVTGGADIVVLTLSS